ncbi:O-6-methylguanine-DNA methyltransferase [Bradyrhizobium sp. STM 3843]|uniref:methylated-DNA--[protein]-cysteine S-methyltransferase n=1 Tax=Bradyrhizobium sp. STM 3843 TaxID=551947 RepID=UPI0002403260|nr:methylated-DNA--[protein]-cysteine S-methyltransferase [Bradyrhizobium sp. STM 3843]CCE10098.1 O-6-methylguanine-DNA methyltransferase [Bradyrhizobium sp. STM 3843]
MGRGYTIFDTSVGRCGIVWSDAGIIGVQLPEAREIETRRRMFRQFPETRELAPPPNAESAIDTIVMMLRGRPADFTDVSLDMAGITPFNQRVYDYIRRIPRSETREPGEIAASLHATGAFYSVAQALAKNPLPLIVPCHRVLAANGIEKASPNRGAISQRRLLSLEGAGAQTGMTLFDALLAVDRPRATH